MNRLKDINLNLGLPQLLSEWKNFFTTQYLMADVLAGITVAFVAIPLSLAIALASGVPPATGLVTAIIAGIVCALFGGTPLAVSGPAAAMSVLIADTAQRFGLQTLVLICFIAGVMQLISGILGFGKLARYVPLPVVAGFTAGIGMIILIGQLPRAFGLTPPAESHIFSVFTHLKLHSQQMNLVCLALVILTIAVIKGLPKLLPRVPPILPAVAVTMLVVYLFHLNNVPLIGEIPRTLPSPHFPTITKIPLGELLFTAFTIYILASLETLLSSTAIDKLTNEKKHNSNQELIGQGLGNIAVSLFSGIPVSGVIARSATNVRAGAKTRRASIIHSVIILLTVFAIAPVISLVPIAALAGVLFSVAFSMINYREFYNLWVTSRAEAFIYSVTFLTIIFVDLIAGVQAGIVVASLIVLWKATQTRLHISASSHDDVTRLSLSGAITFLSTGKITDLEKQLESAPSGQVVLLDLSSVTNLDTSGTTAIIDLFKFCEERGLKFYMKGLPRRFESLFEICDGGEILKEYSLISEQELKKKEGTNAPKSSHGRLIHGVHLFYAERKHNDKRLFEYIVKQQDPHTLFITCSDSRIIPSMITSADPGELFIIRNVGNFIPPYEPDTFYSEAAALEFALTNLDITDIVVCGHANCGAIKACRLADEKIASPKLKAWIGLIRRQLVLNDSLKLNQIARMNVLNQVNNLKTYPLVQQKLNDNALKIHAWFFNFSQNMVYEWDHETMDFKSVISAPALSQSQ